MYDIVIDPLLPLCHIQFASTIVQLNTQHDIDDHMATVYVENLG